MNVFPVFSKYPQHFLNNIFHLLWAYFEKKRELILGEEEEDEAGG